MNPLFSDAVAGVVVEDGIVFTLTELCRASGSGEAQVLALVGEGILDPVVGHVPADWVFDGPSLRTARTALRLTADLGLGIAAAAIVLDLLAQVDALHARLRRAGVR